MAAILTPLHLLLGAFQYYPDVTLKAGWGEITTNLAIAPTANGNDNVGLGLSFNLPLYRDKLAANVREAQSSTIAAAGLRSTQGCNLSGHQKFVCGSAWLAGT